MTEARAPRLRGLYALTPERDERRALESGVRAALEGGVRLVQYRAKGGDARGRLEQARSLAALCRAHDAALIVNDDLELALAIDAAGVHLGRDDGDLAAARARLPGRLLGASCYDRLDLAQSAAAAGADYVAFGSVHASPTKPNAVRAPHTLFAAARPLGVPLCAIGGITLANAAPLVAAGADLLAVISDLFEAPDIRARARAYARLFDSRVPSP